MLMKGSLYFATTFELKSELLAGLLKIIIYTTPISLFSLFKIPDVCVTKISLVRAGKAWDG